MDFKELSNIGFGLYRGDESDAGDEMWIESLLYGLQNGINVIDTAQKYRNGRSEKLIGKVLQKLMTHQDFKRENLFISTKAGLLSESIINSNFLSHLGLKQDQINLSQKFCMEGKYIDWSVDKALEVMKLDYIDAFLLHNPEIVYLSNDGEKKLLQCLEILEQKSLEGKIRNYGIASWNGLRRNPGSVLHIDIISILDKLKDRLGEEINFKIIEAPLSIGMPSVLSYRSAKKNNLSFRDLLKKYDLKFFSSASLYEGHVNELFELNKLFSYLFSNDSPNEASPAEVSFPKSENSLKQLFELLFNLKDNNIDLSKMKNQLSSNNQNIFNFALNMVRSTEFVDCALVGMENINFVKDNLELLHNAKIDKGVVNNYWNKSWKI